MRIAIFTDTYLPDKNGVSTSIDGFSKLLADDGHQIMIFCPKSQLFMDSKYPNITVKRYKSIVVPTYKDIKLAIPSIFSVVKDLRDFNADIVHIQTPMGIGLVAIWATKILKIKNVQTYHTYIPDFLVYISPKTILGINRLTSFIANSKIAKLLTSKNDIPMDDSKLDKLWFKLEKMIHNISISNHRREDKRNEKLGGQYTRAVYNRADLVLTPSAAMKSVLKRQGVKPRVEVMSNGVNFDFFKKKSDYKIKNKIIYTGRLGHEKEIDVVIEAFAIAVKTNPALTLDIYGDGPAKKKLQTLVKMLSLGKKVKFWGAYKIDKIAKKLCEYDFFVTASPIETQGLVILEAMASGLPVLGVNKLAVPEVVKNGKNGYVSEPGNSEEMAKNMLRLLESDEKLQRFGKYSLKIASEHEIKKCKDRLYKAYQKISGVK